MGVFKSVLERYNQARPTRINKNQGFWNVRVLKGFSIGDYWVTALLACVSHVFMDIRFEPYGFAFYPDNVKIILSIIYGIVMGGGF